MDSELILTPREKDIADLVAVGMSNKEIGRELGICHQTVRNMLVNVFRKTETRKRTQLAVKLVLLEQGSIQMARIGRHRVMGTCAYSGPRQMVVTQELNEGD
jgi:DNA-binding CsgD family transcriptional regulator